MSSPARESASELSSDFAVKLPSPKYSPSPKGPSDDDKPVSSPTPTTVDKAAAIPVGKATGFLNVLGCVDGTQIRIATPKVNEADFVNRKGFHALNVQMVCDPKFLITNCVATWPGSCHDARIFRESKLCHNFEIGVHDGFLLGDSGYPCRRYLMTPYHTTGDMRHKERYNLSLCRTRVLIEQTFGILKRRFPCLSTGLRTNPNRAC